MHNPRTRLCDLSAAQKEELWHFHCLLLTCMFTLFPCLCTNSFSSLDACEVLSFNAPTSPTKQEEHACNYTSVKQHFTDASRSGRSMETKRRTCTNSSHRFHAIHLQKHDSSVCWYYFPFAFLFPAAAIGGRGLIIIIFLHSQTWDARGPFVRVSVHREPFLIEEAPNAVARLTAAS